MPWFAKSIAAMALTLAAMAARGQADSSQARTPGEIDWRDSTATVMRLGRVAAGAELAAVPDSTVPLITLGLAWPAPWPMGDLHRRLLARPLRPPFLPNEPLERLRQLGAEFTTDYRHSVASAMLTLPADRRRDGLRLLGDWFRAERFDSFYVGRASADIARELQLSEQLPRAQLSARVAAAVMGPIAEPRPYEALRGVTLAQLRTYHAEVRPLLWVAGGDVDSASVADAFAWMADSLGRPLHSPEATSPAPPYRPLRDSLSLLVNDLATSLTLVVGYQLPTPTATDRVKALLLTELLNLTGTRFHKSMVNRNRAARLRAWLEPITPATALLRIELDPADPREFEACLLALESEISSLLDLTYWRPREVAAAQQRLEAAYEYTREPTSRFCRTLPTWWAVGHLPLAANYPEALRSVDGFALSEWAALVLIDQPTVGSVLAPSRMAEQLRLAQLIDRRNHPERASAPIAAAGLPVISETVYLGGTPSSESEEEGSETESKATSTPDAPVWADSLSAYTIRFALGKTRLDSTARVTLRDLARFMRRHRTLRLYIDGHTDKVGSRAFNQQLSLQRATLVRTYLTGRLRVAEARLRVRAFGERKPLADEATDEGRALNRRVEFLLR